MAHLPTRSVIAAALSLFVLAACSDGPVATAIPDNLDASFSHLAGHGGPKGPHAYQLNIIGVPKEKSADMTGNNGRRIFVPLDDRVRIFLEPGDDFQVTDANGTDGEARFEMPTDVSTEFEVWARALGKPGGEAEITTCAEDPDTGEEVCSTLSTVQIRTNGRNPFTNVTSELLFIHLEDLDAEDEGLGECLADAGLLNGNGNGNGNGSAEVPLFHDCLAGYLWDYDNRGLKLLQLRFYPV